MNSLIPCKHDFLMRVNSRESLDVIRCKNENDDCRIECRKTDGLMWDVSVHLADKDSFKFVVINESGFPLNAVEDLMRTYAECVSS